MNSMFRTFKQHLAILVTAVFAVNSFSIIPAQAQAVVLPPAGSMITFTDKFNPAVIKGMALYPDNPFKFDFIVQQGDESMPQEQIREEGTRLISYFLASLTTPEKEMWVNLSPYEKSRIIPTSFGQTQMGRDLLAQDYYLKQIMATALYPEKEMGKNFWQKVYTQAAQQFGTTNIQVNTFNKVWIVPDTAEIYENAKSNAVFVVNSRLKVMMEQDYLAENINKAVQQFGLEGAPKVDNSAAAAMTARIIKEVVIPALEKEINEGKNFAPLRQIYQSLILAAWYKKNLKESVLTKGYANRNKVSGVDITDKQEFQKIYEQYLKAYRKGVYNYIKEETDPATGQMVPRKYFSGGADFAMIESIVRPTASRDQAMNNISGDVYLLRTEAITSGSTVKQTTDELQVAIDQISRYQERWGGDLRLKIIEGIEYLKALAGDEVRMQFVSKKNVVELAETLIHYANKIYPSENDNDLVRSKQYLMEIKNQIESGRQVDFKINPDVVRKLELRFGDNGDVERLFTAIESLKLSIAKGIQAPVAMGVPQTSHPSIMQRIKRALVAPGQWIFSTMQTRGSLDDKISAVQGVGILAVSVMAFVSSYLGTDFMNGGVAIAALTDGVAEVLGQVASYFPGSGEMSESLIKANQEVVPALQTVASVDKATISQPQQPANDIYGGIDLEKVSINAKFGALGKVKTAFNNPEAMDMLMRADGLRPVVYNIQPASTVLMNNLLGVNAAP